MKAEKEMNWPPSKDWNVYVILGRGRHAYLYTGISRSRADQVVKAFNSALSDHVRSELEKHGIITSPSKSFLDILSGNGKKIDADKFERMKQNYNAIMANSDVAKETETLLAEIDRLKSEVEKIDYAYNSLAQKYNNAVEEVERLNTERRDYEAILNLHGINAGQPLPQSK